MFKTRIYSWTLLLTIFMFSCSTKTELENALEMAGNNHIELEKVLSHYSKNPADSLKLRAAEFLISNMVYHYTYENKDLRLYYNEIIKINNDTSIKLTARNMLDSLSEKYLIENTELKIKYDIQNVKADYLINNINHAFLSWQSLPWSQNISFEDFCEYILPYRIETENLEEWRPKFSSIFQKKLDWIANIDDVKSSTYWAARILSDSIINKGLHIYSYPKVAPLNHPPSVLENIKFGPCEDFAQSTAFIMRACGIPVCIDFTPQWPNRSMGHTWNVLIDENGKEIPFMGREDLPGYPNRPGDLMAKVYRRTYSYQKESLFHLKKVEEIPALFNTPFIKDVTKNYMSVQHVNVELFEKTNYKFAYLAVFDNANWIPISWGKVENCKKAVFENMGRNCMYITEKIFQLLFQMIRDQ